MACSIRAGLTSASAPRDDGRPRDLRNAPPVEPRGPAAQRCQGETLLGVWAHPDDDVIFGNPYPMAEAELQMG